MITEHGNSIACFLPLIGSASLPEHLKDLERKGLPKRGEKRLPTDLWELPRPSDPNGSVRSAVERERRGGEAFPSDLEMNGVKLPFPPRRPAA